MSSPGTTNLLAWWSLNETSGTREDSHTGNRDMSVQGTPSYTTGKVGNAGTISVTSGAGSYFYYSDSGNALDCPSGSSITVCCWVYFDSMPTNHGYPVNRWGDGGGSNRDWAFVVPNNGALTFSVGTTGGQADAARPSSTIGSGAWYFLVGIYDHTVGTHGTAYVSANAGTKTSQALGAAKVAGSGLPVSIGDLSHTSVTYGTMAGAVDEVCIYQRVLTDDEISWLYNSGNGRTYAELVPLTIAPDGLAVGVAFGDATVEPGEVDIAPDGLAVAVGFGAAVVGRGAVEFEPEGTAVGVAFGAAVVGVGVVDIAPSGLAVGVGFGTAVVVAEGVALAIEPDGLAVGLAMGDITVTRRAAVDVPLYVIDFDERVWTVPAESRLYYVEA